MNLDESNALRKPFAPEQVGKLPRAGTLLDFVGHANVTARLLDVDPEWSWEPCAWAEQGTPLILTDGNNAILWIRLTVCGVTRLGVGIVGANMFELQKQLISDALRNAAMRFGVALDLWSKEPLTEAALPSAEPTATALDIKVLQAAVDALPWEQRAEFLAWKSEQDFKWPWTLAAFEAMQAKHNELVEIVGVGAVGGDAAASSDTDEGGEPGPVMDQPGSVDAAPASPPSSEPFAGFSGEPFDE